MSPRQLIEQKNLDFHKDLGIPFGSYVEAGQKTTNTAKARSSSAIYLGVSSNIQGGHEVMALDTGLNLVHRKLPNFPSVMWLLKELRNWLKIRDSSY